MPEKTTAVQTATEPKATTTTTLKLVEPETLIDRMNRMHDAIARRAFEMFAGDGSVFGRDIDYWLKAEAELLHPAHVQITESDDAVELRAEAPGFDPKQLEVSVEPGRVTITGKKESTEESKRGKTVYNEQCSSEIFRVIDLPAEIEPAEATAALKNGMLTLTAPKVAQAKSRTAAKVEVKAA